MNCIEIAEKVSKEGCQVFRPRKGGGGYDAKSFFTGNKRGWVALDAFSAGAILAVYRVLSDEQKALYVRLSPVAAAKLAFKVVK